MKSNESGEWVWGDPSEDASDGSNESTDAESRRNILRYVATGTSVAALSVLSLGVGSQASVAATTSFSAANMTLSSNAGQLQSLTVQPSMDYEWNGLDSEPKRIDFYVDARLTGGNYEQIGAEGTTIDSTAYESSSTKTYDFANAVSILDHTGISDSDFEGTGGSWTKDTTVEMKVRTELEDANGNTFSDTVSDSFTVSLTNEQGNANAGGQANTGGSAT